MTTRRPLLRPTLLPGLARTWRDPHTLQLGLDPARAVLLDLPDPRAARLLDLLDGTRPERAIVDHARRHGVAADDVRALLDLLHEAGLVLSAPALVPAHLPADTRRRLGGEAAALALSTAAPDRRTATPATAGVRPAAVTPATRLRRRAAARVVLAGKGRLAAPIAVTLAAAGVGHVHADVAGTVAPEELAGGPLTGADIGRPRRDAITDAVTRAAPGTGTRPVQRGGATLLIQLRHDEPVALLAAGHAQRGQAHLVVALREGTAVVGPLVTPGRGSCLSCIELHRTDRDPFTRHVAGRFADAEPAAVTTLLAAAAYASAQALTHLDGGSPETAGATVDVTGAGRLRRRSWPPHPSCGCGRRRAAPP